MLLNLVTHYIVLHKINIILYTMKLLLVICYNYVFTVNLN